MKVLLLKLLINPKICTNFTDADWDIVIPQARNTGVLGSLGLLLDANGLHSSVPPEVRRHLDSVVCVHRKQLEGLNYEIKCLGLAMAEAGEKLILLKGAAYVLGKLPPATGRLFSDIDFLVPELQLQTVENTLQQHGWESVYSDSYDEVYYRKWMHEIPPMVHGERDSVLDVHHTILPPTADEKFDPTLLFENLHEVQPGIYVLSPVNMVLHSATHLFHEGEFTHGLRDLIDLDRLVRHFSSKDDSFWQQLLSSAQTMGMVNSLHHALRYTHMFLATPIPSDLYERLKTKKPRFPGTAVMDFLFIRGFLPSHRSCALPYSAFAHYCLFIRSHYLRMPLYLLLPHLTRKAWAGRFSNSPGGVNEEGESQK